MNRLRLADVRAPIARVLNVCSTEPRVAEYANEAHRRLVAAGKWLGTVQRYRVCVGTSGCIVWPRQVETIEAWAICNEPGDVRNGWYELSQQGPGPLTDVDAWYNTLVDRGMTPLNDAIAGTASKLFVVSEQVEAAGLRLLVRGYDQNSKWVRTQDAGVWIDGEYIDITHAGAFSAGFYTNVTSVLKPATVSPVTVWEYDTTTSAATTRLADYEPDETEPLYRASLVPGLANRQDCGNSLANCCGTTGVQITVVCKLRHIDVVEDNDLFLLGNLGALKLMVMALLKEERNLLDEAVAYEGRARKLLQDELSSYEGDGSIPLLKSESSQTWGAGVVNPLTLGWRRIY